MIGIPVAHRWVVKVRYFTHTARLWAAMLLAAAYPDSPPPGRYSEDIHSHNPAMGCNPYGAAQLVSPDSPTPGRKSEKIPGREKKFSPSPIHSTHPAFTTPRPPQRVPGGTLIVRYDGPCMFVPSQVLRVMGAPSYPASRSNDTAGGGPPSAAPSAPVRPCTRGVKRPMGEWKNSVYG